MKTLIITLTTLLSCVLTAVSQPQGRGAASQPMQGSTPKGTTRALVIGISKYLEIEPLKFADKDAQEFANYLMSKAGGSVPKTNLQLLLNEQANIGNIISALEWLKEESKENDQVIIYFSGHGDVETLTDAQNGFLLTYNSPKKVYVAGALPIYLLKDYITTLGNRKVSTVMITDACRSGKLAGGQQGARLTSTALLNQWNNEIKIMSCQPGQFSLEGKEWGGGRGAFSYHLIDGLMGMADKNNDRQVSLKELEDYVTDKLIVETQKLQEPIFEGKGKTVTMLADVDSVMLTSLVALRNKQSTLVAVSGLKGTVPGLNDGTDSATLRLYGLFDDAISRGSLIAPAGSNAWDYLKELEKKSPEHQLTRIARRNLTASLLNDVQDLLNRYLDGRKFFKVTDFKKGDEELAVTLELLGPKHPFYHTCKARQLFMKAASVDDVFTDQLIDDREYEKALSLLEQAQQVEPEAAYIYQVRGEIYARMQKYPEAISNLQQAIKLSPTWVMPYYMLGGVYSSVDSTKKSIECWEKALSLDSTMKTFECTKCTFLHLGDLYLETGEYKKAEGYFDKAIQADSSFVEAYAEKFGASLAKEGIWILVKKGKVKKAAREFEKCLPYCDRIDSLSVKALVFKTRYELRLNKKKAKYLNDSAMYYSQAVFDADTTDAAMCYNLAELYYDAGNMEKAISLYERTMAIDSTAAYAAVAIADIYMEKAWTRPNDEVMDHLYETERLVNKYLRTTRLTRDRKAELLFAKASLHMALRDMGDEDFAETQLLDELEDALKSGYEEKDMIKYRFSSLEKDERYKALIKKYFPKK